MRREEPNTLRPLPREQELELCPECDGQGEGMAGWELVDCPTCHGTGLMPTQADIQRENFEQAEADRSSYERHLGL